MKISILGTGTVGLALGKGWMREGHQVTYGSRNPAAGGDRVYPVGKEVECHSLKDAVEWGDVVVLAVPYRGLHQVLDEAGPARFKGKVVVDATNALDDKFQWALGFGTSGAEETQTLLPGAQVVKAFNTAFADTMSLGRIGSTKLAAFVAADDIKAKATVLQLASDLGFDPVDAGPLKSARYLEAMAMQLITLGYGLKMGPTIGFALVRKK